MESLVTYELENDCKKNRIKPSRIETLLSRQSDIKSRFYRVNSDMISLSTTTMASLAGALVSLGHLPAKLNPVIKPLMESIKKEPILQLQKLSAQKLVLFLDLCIQNKMPNPAEKVTRNLIHFAYGDNFENGDDIITLLKEDLIEEETIQIRGTKEALKFISLHFGTEITSKPPKFFERVILPFQQDHLWKNLNIQELAQFLHTYQVVATSIHENLHKELLKTYQCLSNILAHSQNCARFLAAQTLASLASFKPNETISAVIEFVIPTLEHSNVATRQGAIEAMAAIVQKLELKFVPYIVLFIVPILGRLSDSNPGVRQLATQIFANLIKLIPLDSQKEDADLPKHLLELKLSQRSFIDELMSLKNVQDIDMPVKINAELRSYQIDGVKWLSFLNRYKLHGILCDDMGLGKTLQTICMLAKDHCQRSKEGQEPSPSLIVCPATLCLHWYSEIQKFAPNLRPFVYSGNMCQRQPLRRDLMAEFRSIKAECNLAVITSYDIVRSDVDLFGLCHWNYLVLDEGHAIRNAKTKTTVAIKSLKAHHRLILSGTPIQNSVIELWSLFDFLMPGFLGNSYSENAYNTNYATRDPKFINLVSKFWIESGIKCFACFILHTMGY